jgi:hypothetical protein
MCSILKDFEIYAFQVDEKTVLHKTVFEVGASALGWGKVHDSARTWRLSSVHAVGLKHAIVIPFRASPKL